MMSSLLTLREFRWRARARAIALPKGLHGELPTSTRTNSSDASRPLFLSLLLLVPSTVGSEWRSGRRDLASLP